MRHVYDLQVLGKPPSILYAYQNTTRYDETFLGDSSVLKATAILNQSVLRPGHQASIRINVEGQQKVRKLSDHRELIEEEEGKDQRCPYSTYEASESNQCR